MRCRGKSGAAGELTAVTRPPIPNPTQPIGSFDSTQDRSAEDAAPLSLPRPGLVERREGTVEQRVATAERHEATRERQVAAVERREAAIAGQVATVKRRAAVIERQVATTKQR